MKAETLPYSTAATAFTLADYIVCQELKLT